MRRTMLCIPLAIPCLVQIASIALGGLLVYDVFWVFISPFLFNKNVMVEVAKQAADNPAHAIAKSLPMDLPESALPPLHVQLPNKFTLPVYTWAEAGMTLVKTQEVVQHTGLVNVGSTMLGLGDVALPGLLLALAYRFDRARRMKQRQDCRTDHRVSSEAGSAVVQGTAVAPSVVKARGEAASPADEDEEAPLLRSSSPPSSDAHTGDHTCDSQTPDSQQQPAGGAAGAPMPLAEWLPACWSEIKIMLSSECPLFRATLAAYAAGLVCTYVISYGFHAAQPALLYLVPFTLGGLAFAGRREGVFMQLWAGNN